MRVPGGDPTNGDGGLRPLPLKQMKVGFLVSSVSREAGGLFQSVRGLAKATMSEDATVNVFGISDARSASDSLKWRPLSVQTFQPQFRAWGYSNQLMPALLAADLDILSVHGLWKYCSVASRRWHRRTGRAYIVHPEGMLESWALRNGRWKKRIAALLYENEHLRKAACLRALSEAEAQSIRAFGMRNPVCIIPNGVDLPDLVESSALEVESLPFQKSAQGRKVLLYLGRLHPKKNVANLIRAWKQTSQLSSVNPGELGACNRRMGSGRLRKRTEAYCSCPVGRFSGSAVRRRQGYGISRLRRIHSTIIERRLADNGAGSLGVCETGADDTRVQSARRLGCRGSASNWDCPGGNSRRCQTTHRNE